MPITLQIESPDKPEIVDLVRQLDKHLKSIYPLEATHLLDIRTLLGANIRFVTARDDGRCVGCGALRFFDGEYAEVKRMFVLPSERGKGIARHILAELQKLAVGDGLKTLRLETGILQVEAIGLYEKFGFYRIPVFGEYTENGVSICYEKQI